jgi:hypothetical protein
MSYIEHLKEAINGMDSSLNQYSEDTINEMLVVGDKNNDMIIAFDKWIYLVNDDDTDIEMQNIKDEIATNLNFEQYDEAASMYDFMIRISETYPDVLVGNIRDKNLYIQNYSSFKLDPKSSILVKKVVDTLKLKSVNVSQRDYDVKVPKKKIVGEIPDIAYHGTTSKYLDGILRIGLRPNERGSNWADQGIEHRDKIFFTTLIDEAMGHARMTAHKKGGIPIILELQIPDKDLMIADYDVEGETGAHEFYDYHVQSNKSTYKSKPMSLSKEFGIYGYKGNIKPVFIKNIYVAIKPADEVYSMDDFKKMKPKTAARYIEYGYGDY